MISVSLYIPCRVFMSAVTLLNGGASLLILAVPKMEQEKVTEELCCSRRHGTSCRRRSGGDGDLARATEMVLNCTTIAAPSGGGRLLSPCHPEEEVAARCVVETGEVANWRKSFWTYMFVSVPR